IDAASVHASAFQCSPPCLPRRLRTGFDGIGRDADSRPVESGGARCAGCGRAWRLFEPLVPAYFFSRKSGARTNPNRRAFCFHRIRCGTTCAAHFERLSSQRVLLIGAGSMIEVCAAHFAAQRPHALVIANRTIERSLKLAERTNGRAIALASLPARLHEFDIVVSCTASVLPIIGLGAVERALRARKRRPVLMVDLAMPRDIEAEVAQLQDVFLYTLDDLGAVVQKAHTQRQTAAIQAEAIIETRVERFMRWLDARRGAPAICKLHEEAHRLRSAALARAQQRLACGEDPKAVLEAFSYRLTHTLLHAPTRALTQAQDEERARLVQLFGISA